MSSIVLLCEGFMVTATSTKNIKVNVPATPTTKRSSTTLSYLICDFYFGGLLDPASKSKQTKLGTYRAWLESTVQSWVNDLEYALVSNTYLEYQLLALIRDHSYKAGLDKNRDNLGLDV